MLAAFAAEHGISFSLLSDEGSRVIRALGLLNERVYEQHAAFGIPRQERHWGTPYPGTFVLDESGRVTDKRFYQVYRERETGTGALADAFGVECDLHGAESRSETGPVQARAYLDSPTYRFFQRLYLTVELALDPGIHVYGRPIPDGYVPLSVDLDPIAGMIVGEPRVPVPKPFWIEGLDESFFVYENRVTFRLPLTFSNQGPDLEIRGSVRYQACSQVECWPPTSWQFGLALTAADLVGRPRKRE